MALLKISNRLISSDAIVAAHLQSRNEREFLRSRKVRRNGVVADRGNIESGRH